MLIILPVVVGTLLLFLLICHLHLLNSLGCFLGYTSFCLAKKTVYAFDVDIKMYDASSNARNPAASGMALTESTKTRFSTCA